jgi:hypothetical protein
VLSLANLRGCQVGGRVASEGVGRGWRDDKGSLAVEGLAAGGELWAVDATSDSEAGEVYPESGGAGEIWRRQGNGRWVWGCRGEGTRKNEWTAAAARNRVPGRNESIQISVPNISCRPTRQRTLSAAPRLLTAQTQATTANTSTASITAGLYFLGTRARREMVVRNVGGRVDGCDVLRWVVVFGR